MNPYREPSPPEDEFERAVRRLSRAFERFGYRLEEVAERFGIRCGIVAEEKLSDSEGGKPE